LSSNIIIQTQGLENEKNFVLELIQENSMEF